jgi:hypothetical protein
MAIFEEVTIAWNGREYKIPPTQVMQAIARVEDIISLAQMAKAQLSGDIPFVKLSRAFATLLRCAGAAVEDDEIYAALFASPEAVASNSLTAISTLQMLMIPPQHLRARMAADEKESEAKKSPASVT